MYTNDTQCSGKLNKFLLKLSSFLSSFHRALLLLHVVVQEEEDAYLPISALPPSSTSFPLLLLLPVNLQYERAHVKHMQKHVANIYCFNITTREEDSVAPNQQLNTVQISPSKVWVKLRHKV